jgi:N6-adenosine-specific RNA methylase IME4
MRNSEGGLIELFARNARPGWDAWGNEITRAAAE